MITIHQGSILNSDADFIVNPANSFLQHDGGLALIIADAATATNMAANPPFGLRAALNWRDEQLLHPNIATGDVGVTSAGVLPYKAIIHAVGPIYKDGSLWEPELLHLAHVNAIKTALSLGGGSIAFPAISCGIFGYPIDKAARTAMTTARYHESELDIDFWLFSDEHYEAYMTEFSMRG